MNSPLFKHLLLFGRCKIRTSKPCTNILKIAYNGFSTNKVNAGRTWSDDKVWIGKSEIPSHAFTSKISEFSGKDCPLFASDKVQKMLKRITGKNLDKVLKARTGKTYRPTYKLMDEKEVKMAEQDIHLLADERLEMPAVKTERKDVERIISEDKDCIGFDREGADFVFTDISPSETKSTRSVIVRENATGILREASWDQRERMNEMYWPQGRDYTPLPMAENEQHMANVFEQLNHENLLDYIHHQYELDSPKYIRVLHQIYNDLAERKAFDLLRFTCYYGGFIYYLVKNQRTIEVFEHFVLQRKINIAADIVRLSSLVHEDLKFVEDQDDLNVVTTYIADNQLIELTQFLNEDTALSM